MPNLHSNGTHFEIGKAIQLTPSREKYSVAIIAIGEAVAPAFQASRLLEEKGMDCCVLSLHSLRPFDEEAVRKAAMNSKVVITVEEHSINGGLGSRVASTLMQAAIFRPFRIVGIPDEHTVCGSQSEIFNHYGITAQGLYSSVEELLEMDAA
jgi:transketolase